jgi:lambda family phage minor tail protein L
MTIEADVQTSAPGALVALFDIDLTPLGGEVLHFVGGTMPGAKPGEYQPARWRGNVYMPAPFEGTGFETNGRSALPTPTIRIGSSRELTALLRRFGDCVGMKVTRWRTFSKYLDGQPQADPNAHFPPDVFLISRKVSQNKVNTEWELAAEMDQQGKRLPARLILRDACTWRYRAWDAEAGAFDYTDVLCPYTGSACYDRLGQACEAAADTCGKKLSDCALRFGNAQLPTSAFPGVSRSRVS